MYNWFKLKNENQVKKQLNELDLQLINTRWTASVTENEKKIKDLFKDVDITIYRNFTNNIDNSIKFVAIYSDGVSNAELISEFIIKPLMNTKIDKNRLSDENYIKDLFITINDATTAENANEVIQAVTYGDTALFVEGCNKALVLNSKSFTLRSPSEPEGEKVLLGPREGFSEGIMQNISFIRRRLRTHQLKLKFQTMGRETKTTVCVAYMDNIVDKKILKELYKRLDTVDMDGILDSNYISEHIGEQSLFGFASIGYTERPDIVAAKLLEGRIALFVDGTPMVLTLPYLFIENFQSNEDYYMNYFIHPLPEYCE